MADRAWILEQIGRRSHQEFAHVRQNERRRIVQRPFALAEFEAESEIMEMIIRSEHHEQQY